MRVTDGSINGPVAAAQCRSPAGEARNYNNNKIYLLQLGCYPLAVVILHVNKHEIGCY